MARRNRRTSRRGVFWPTQKISQRPSRRFLPAPPEIFQFSDEASSDFASFCGWPARCRATFPASRMRCAWCRENRWRKAAPAVWDAPGSRLTRQRGGDQVRQMARPADKQIVPLRCPAAAFARRAISKIVPLCGPRRHWIFLSASRRRRRPQTNPRRRRSRRFFPAGHWMTANEMRAGFGNERFEFAHDAGFHAADIGDNAPRFRAGRISCDERTHLRERRA